MKKHLAIALYVCLQGILLPFILIFLGILHLRRKNQDSLVERLGFLPKSPINKRVVWFHAVSAGEVLALQEVIATIKREQPASWCYLTVGTPTGRRMAERHLSADSIAYLPYDLLPCMLLAYSRIKPSALVVVEAELWPLLFFSAWWRTLPLILLNARVSQRSQKRLTLLAPLVRLLLECCTAILAQSEADRAAFIALGLQPERITVLSNIKAFNVFYKRLQEPAKPPPHQYYTLLAGSIHPTEDEVYLGLFKQLKNTNATAKLVLVPRHFHWQEALMQHALATGFTTAIWDTNSNPNTSIRTLLESADIIIVLRFGELFNLYQYATLFFLGGTFVPVGGHNLLEPAAWGTPSIVGPFHANCRATLQALTEHHAARVVNSQDELAAVTTTLLESPAELAAMQQANSAWIKKEAHRVEHTMRTILFRALFSC